MLVFRFGKDLEKVGFLEKRMVFGGDGGVDAGPGDSDDLDAGVGAPPEAGDAGSDGETDLPAGAEAAPEAPVEPAVEAAEAEAEHEGEAQGAKVEAKAHFVSLKTGVEIAGLQAKMGEDFGKFIEVFNGQEIVGEITMKDLNPDLTFKPDLDKRIGTNIGASLQKLQEADWEKIKGYFDPYYETGSLDQFKGNFAQLMGMVGVAGLKAQLKALPHIDKYEGFTKNGIAVSYKVKGLSTEVAMVDASGAYKKFVEEKGVEVQSQDEEKAMLDAIKKNGGWIGSIVLALAKTKDPITGKTFASRLLSGELPFISAVLGMRGVDYAPFKQLADNIKESAGQDPRVADLLGKVESMVGKGKGALKAETLSLFDSAKKLVADGFSSWVDGKQPLDDLYALSDGYTSTDTPLGLLIPKGEKLRIPPKTKYTLALGKGKPLSETTVGDDPAIIEAPKVAALTIVAKELPPKTILPKGTTVVDIA